MKNKITARHLYRFAGYSTAFGSSKLFTAASLYAVALSVSDLEYGYFTLAQAALYTATAILSFTSHVAYVRYYYDYGARAVAVGLKRLYALSIVVSILAGAMLFTIFHSDPRLAWFSLLPLCGALMGLVLIVTTVARCAGDVLGYAIAELARPIVVFLAVLLFIVSPPQMLAWSPVAIYILAITTSLLLGLFLSRQTIAREFRPANGKELPERTLVGFLFPLIVVHWMAIVNNYGDRYLLAGFVDMDTIGSYGKAYLFGSTFGLISDSAALLWDPLVVKHRESFVQDLSRTVRLVFGFLMAGSLAIAATSFFVFFRGITVLALSPSFLLITGLVLSAYVARTGYQIYLPVLNAFDLTRTVAVAYACGMAVSLVANIGLIPTIGTIGAAVATWLSFLTIAVLASAAVQRRIVRSISGRPVSRAREMSPPGQS